MQYEVDRANDSAGEPSIAEMTEKAIKILQRNPKGYFLLVEGEEIYVMINPFRPSFFALLRPDGVGGGGGGGGRRGNPPPTSVTPRLPEYKSYDNETWRVDSMSENVYIDVQSRRGQNPHSPDLNSVKNSGRISSTG